MVSLAFFAIGAIFTFAIRAEPGPEGSSPSAPRGTPV